MDLLLHILDKNVMKAMFVVRKLLKVYPTKYYFDERKFLVFPHCGTERVREEKPKLFGNISTGKRKFKSTFFPTVVVFFTSFLLLLLLYP